VERFYSPASPRPRARPVTTAGCGGVADLAAARLPRPEDMLFGWVFFLRMGSPQAVASFGVGAESCAACDWGRQRRATESTIPTPHR
jgi:hypothetical protein